MSGLASKNDKFKKYLRYFLNTVFIILLLVLVYFHGETISESLHKKYVLIGIVFIVISFRFINYYKVCYIIKFFDMKRLICMILIFVAVSSGSLAYAMIVRIIIIFGTYSPEHKELKKK